VLGLTCHPHCSPLPPCGRIDPGCSMVAVGTAIADGPPHRSRRALLTHRAPPSGSGVETDLKIEVLIEGAAFGNPGRKVRGEFSLNGVRYRLAVTDPIVESKYLAGNDGTYDVGNAILCISLGEPYKGYAKGYAYKLIAGVIVPSDS